MSDPPCPSPVKVLPSTVPPLTIRFLLAWTAATALMLAWLLNPQAPAPLDNSDDVQTLDKGPSWGTILAVPSAAAGAWMGCGSLLIGWHAIRSRRWIVEPGEWLILSWANLLALFVVLRLWMKLMDGRDLVDIFLHYPIPLTYRIYGLSWLLVTAEIAVVFLIAAAALRRQFLWSAMFGVLTLGMLATQIAPWIAYQATVLVERCLFCATYGSWVLALCLLVAAVIHDRRQRLPRRWLHWSGVLISVVLLGSWAALFCWIWSLDDLL